jgi:ABC-2 type transport system permease protein
VQGIFPLVFVVLFVSTAFYPEALLGSPVDVIADYNPLSYVVDGLRDPIISSTTARPVLEGLAAAVGIVAVFGSLSLVALRGRLRDA